MGFSASLNKAFKRALPTPFAGFACLGQNTVPKLDKVGFKEVNEREWRKRKQFVINQPVEHDNMRIIHIEVANKTAEGILENNIYLIERKGILEAEIASIMNPRIKWMLKDYLNVLTQSGFKKVNEIRREKDMIIIAIK